MRTSRKLNKKCPVCDAMYSINVSCRDRGTWRSVCDTERHYQIYVTLIQYTRNVITASEARMLLDNIGFKRDEINALSESSADIITKIFEETD